MSLARACFDRNVSDLPELKRLSTSDCHVPEDQPSRSATSASCPSYRHRTCRRSCHQSCLSPASEQLSQPIDDFAQSRTFASGHCESCKWIVGWCGTGSCRGEATFVREKCASWWGVLVAKLVDGECYDPEETARLVRGWLCLDGASTNMVLRENKSRSCLVG